MATLRKLRTVLISFFLLNCSTDIRAMLTATQTATPTSQAAGNTLTLTTIISNGTTLNITSMLFQNNVNAPGNANLEVANVTTTNLGTPTITTTNNNVMVSNATLPSGQQGTVTITTQIPCNAQVNTYNNNSVANVTYSDGSTGFVSAPVQYMVSSSLATLKNVAISADCTGTVKITGTTDIGNSVTISGPIAGTAVVSSTGNFTATIHAENGTYNNIVVSASNPTTGCTATMTLAVVVGAAVLENVMIQSDCSGDVTITGTTDPEDSVTIGGDLSATPTIDPTTGEFTAMLTGIAAGTYTIIVTATNPTTGCSQTNTQSIVIGASPELMITSSGVCVGTSVTLEATAGFASYQFFANGTAISGVQASNTFTTMATVNPTNYTVTVTSAAGCTGTSSAVTVGTCALLTLSNCCSKTVLSNSTTSFTVTVTNNGSTAATNLIATYTVPSCFTITSASGTGWAFTTSGQVVTATLPLLAVGASSSFTLTATICCNRGQKLTTIATVQSDASPLQTTTALIVTS